MMFILFVLIRNKRQRVALQEAESKIETLQTLAMEFDRKEDNLRQLALKHFDILKKVALLDGMMNDLKTGQEKKIKTLFNQAVYENNTSFDWDTFFKALNPLKNGIPEKVRDFYPQLTETEYRILILSFTGLSNKETSIILNLSTNTINSLRTSIRRKLQVPEYGDLEEFVTNQLTFG
jgi:DNA-binding CsgD family transcriptional regulator